MINNFEVQKRVRMRKGGREHAHDWHEYTIQRLLREAQEELIDCSNYLDMLKLKNPLFNFEKYHLTLKNLWEELEQTKKEQ